MTRWTTEQVEGAAPDSSSIAAARKLARPGPWSDTGSSETLLWGKCQGSGRTPYQVSVDLTGPAFRCSCPSRKFPCKHALALMLICGRRGRTPSPMRRRRSSRRSVRTTGRAERVASRGRSRARAESRSPQLRTRWPRSSVGRPGSS